MQAPRKAFNPFSFLLALLGAIFVVTICAYVVMMVKQSAPADAAGSASLLSFLNSHGDKMLLAELAAMAVLTVGAIATDDYWERRANRDS